MWVHPCLIFAGFDLIGLLFFKGLKNILDLNDINIYDLLSLSHVLFKALFTALFP